MGGEHFTQIVRLAGGDYNNVAASRTESFKLFFHLPEMSLAQDSHQVPVKDQDHGAGRKL